MTDPIPANAERMTAAAEIRTCQRLLAHLDAEGLQSVRGRLKDLDLVRICGEGALAEMRADLLDATCRRLVEAGRAPAIYFVHAGDMLPDAPDMVPDFPDFGGAEGVK